MDLFSNFRTKKNACASREKDTQVQKVTSTKRKIRIKITFVYRNHVENIQSNDVKYKTISLTHLLASPLMKLVQSYYRKLFFCLEQSFSTTFEYYYIKLSVLLFEYHGKVTYRNGMNKHVMEFLFRTILNGKGDALYTSQIYVQETKRRKELL